MDLDELGFDAFIDISTDGEVEVEENTSENAETVSENVTEAVGTESADDKDEESVAEEISGEAENEVVADEEDTKTDSSEEKKESFEESINSSIDALKGLFSGIANKVSQKADELQAKEKVEKIAGAVGEKFESVVKNVENKFSKSGSKNEEGNKEDFESEVETVDKEIVCDGYCESCDGCADVPGSDDVEHVEGQIVGSMEDKFAQLKQKVSEAAKTITPVVTDAAKAVAPKVKEAAATVIPKVKETAKELGPKVKETAKTIGPKVKDVAKNIGPKVKDVAKTIGPKVKETAGNVAPQVKEKAKSVAESISFEGYRLKSNVKKKVKNKVKEKVLGKTDEDGQNVRVKKVKKYSSNFMNHAMTVSRHRRMVIKHCAKAGIPLQGLTHDLSKYSPAEFKYGVKFFRGDRSPNEGEREAYGYSNAWMHHKGRNKHHFEYWLDYNIEVNKAMPVKMPLKYVIEMFCDRVAAGKIYKKEAYNDNAPYEYFDKNRSRRNLHPETSDFLEKLLKMLAEKGEDYTFTYIRWYLKHHKTY